MDKAKGSFSNIIYYYGIVFEVSIPHHCGESFEPAPCRYVFDWCVCPSACLNLVSGAAVAIATAQGFPNALSRHSRSTAIGPCLWFSSFAGCFPWSWQEPLTPIPFHLHLQISQIVDLFFFFGRTSFSSPGCLRLLNSPSAVWWGIYEY